MHTEIRTHPFRRYIYADSESVGAVVETPKLLELLMGEDGKGLEGADGVRYSYSSREGEGRTERVKEKEGSKDGNRARENQRGGRKRKGGVEEKSQAETRQQTNEREIRASRPFRFALKQTTFHEKSSRTCVCSGVAGTFLHVVETNALCCTFFSLFKHCVSLKNIQCTLFPPT